MSVEEQVLQELSTLSSAVSGVEGCMVATSDGLLVSHIMPGLEQTQVAALVSTMTALARQAVLITGRGDLLEAAIRGTDGYLAVYAVGEGAVLAILGRPTLNIALLQLRTRPVVTRLEAIAANFTRFSSGPVLADHVDHLLQESGR